MLSKLTKHEYALNTEHEIMLPKRSEAKTTKKKSISLNS